MLFFFFAVDDRAASSRPAGAWLSSWQCGWRQRVNVFVLMLRYFDLLYSPIHAALLQQ